MSDQIDTLYEQSGLDQTALTNGVTLATAGPNETITIRDIQISNPGRTLDLKIGNTTILTNTGSTSYGGTEYIGPGQSLTLTYRSGTYPPAAQTAPYVYANKFTLVNNFGKRDYFLNAAERRATGPDTAIPWSGSTTLYGMFTSRDQEVARGGPGALGFNGSGIFVSATTTRHYYQNYNNTLTRIDGRLDVTTYGGSRSETPMYASISGTNYSIAGCCYDGSRYIYGFPQFHMGTGNMGNNVFYIYRLDTITDTASVYTIQAVDPLSRLTYYRAESNSYAAGEPHPNWHQPYSSCTSDYLDGYIYIQPNYLASGWIVNTNTSTAVPAPARNRIYNDTSNHRGQRLFAKSQSGDYVVGFYSNDHGYDGTITTEYNTFYWWNIGPDPMLPAIKNAGAYRDNKSNNYMNMQEQNHKPSRDPNLPWVYYSQVWGYYSPDLTNSGSARNNSYLRIIDFAYGYPQYKYFRNYEDSGIGQFNSSPSRHSYIIPSLINYSWTAPATPAFGTVDVRVAGIRSSI